MTLEFTISLLAATVQSGTPILYATLGEIVTEKGGILNLGVEGMMMVGALAAFVAAKLTGSPTLAFVIGGLCGSMLAVLHGAVCLGFQGNQVVSGLALTIFGTGLANYLGTPFIGQSVTGFSVVPLPGLVDIPVLGPVLFNQDPLVYVSYVLPILLWFFFHRTRWGLHVRSVGENPASAAAAGLQIHLIRWLAVLAGGFFVGLGGAYLSLAYTHLWTNGLSAGRGWIAVALVIFAYWKPMRAFLGAYLFGGVMAFQLRLQAMGTHIPSSLLLMLPYALTVFVLVLSSWNKKNKQAPAILGVNIEPSE
jgi:simple sugar transport system permease protein